MPVSAPPAPDEVRPEVRRFTCTHCGAALAYEPGADSLRCEACGQRQALPALAELDRREARIERPYDAAIRALAAQTPRLPAQVLDCPGCGATLRLDGFLAATRCPFCALALTLRAPRNDSVIAPQALLPMRVAREEAQRRFAGWVGSRWFAPSALKRNVRAADGLRGVYLPCWTYDARSVTEWRGERGVDRQQMVSRTNVKGETETVSETVTDWTPVSGVSEQRFDDELVPASPALSPDLVPVLDDMPLQDLEPWREDALAGFSAELHRIGLAEGFERARAAFEPRILAQIRRDIGGDSQRIHEHRSSFHEIGFKPIQLPLWSGGYRHAGQAYQVWINGVTGRVEGQRPWSRWKIGAAVAAALLLVLALYLLWTGMQATPAG